MLLNKSAFLRASVSEVLALATLQPVVRKFKAVNEAYLAAVIQRQQVEEAKRLHADRQDRGRASHPTAKAVDSVNAYFPSRLD